MASRERPGSAGVAGGPGAALGVAGRTALAGAVGGGVLVGGFMIGALAAAGRMRSSHLLMLGTQLFLIGALLGFLHGAVLGYLGREAGADGRLVRRQLARAAGYAPLPLVATWAASGWIATAPGNLLYGNLALLVATGFGVAGGFFALAWALRTAWAALVGAYGRWPQRLAGTALVACAFALLLVAFLAMPATAFGGFAPTALGAVLAAGGVTVWLVGPVTTLGLRRRREE